MNIETMTKKQVKEQYAKFQETEDYKRVYGAEKKLDLRMNGVMFFLFDHWLSKQPSSNN